MSISRKFQRSKSKYTLSQKIISAVTAAGFIMQPIVGFAQSIIRQDGTNLGNNQVTDIWAEKVINDNVAINRFQQFQLDAGKIANMYFNELNRQDADVNNLVNFVDTRIDINGTVNAIQNSQIGGNLFFLSKEGMAVGKSGVINTGSLYVMTPTQDYIKNMKVVAGTADAATAEKELNAITNITKDANAWQAIPVNTSGTITVLGKVNATNEVQMRAAKIGVGKNNTESAIGDVAANDIVKDAFIKTGITDFSNIVNIAGTDGNGGVDAGLTGDALTATQTGSGDIVLSAYVDGANKTNELGELPVVGTTLETIGATIENTFEEQEFDASVDVYGTVETTGEKGAININATAINSNADYDGTIKDYKLNNNNNVAQLAKVKADVNIGGTVKAVDDVTVKAEAVNRYIDNSGGFINGLKLAISSGTPLTGDAAYSVLGTEANVNITSAGSVESTRGNVDIDAKAETLVASAASTLGLKFKTAGGTTGANVPAVAVVYTDVDNKANVTVAGNVKAKENISIDADADMKVEAENKMSLMGKQANQFVVGVTVANADNSANVTISGTDNKIEAGNDLNVNADATSDFTSRTSIKAPEASAMAVAVNVTDFNSNANVNIDTKLQADNALNVKANNIITDDNVNAESTIGSGKYMSAATQIVTGHVEQKKGEVKEWIGTLAGKISDKLQEKLSGSDDADIPSLQLSEIFKAGATVTYSGQKHGSNVTIGENASLNAGGKMAIDALTKIEDAHITATGTTASYNDAYPAEATLNAAVLVNNMDNSSSVVVEDAVTDEKGEHKATIKAANGVDINASTRFEYNRIKNMIQDVKDAAAQISDAVSGLDSAIKSDFDAFLRNLDAQIDAWESAFKTADETFATSDSGVLAIGEAATAGLQVLTALNNLNTMLDGNEGGQVAADVKATIQGASDILTGALAFADPNSYGNFAAASASKGSSGDTSAIAGHHPSAINGAGTVMVNNVDSVSKVEIGSNSEINSNGKVNLNAENYMKDVSLGGLNTVPLTNSGGGTVASIGATVNYSDFNTDTIVAVNDGASISGGDINIAGSNEIDHVSVAGGAGMGPSDETGSNGIVLNGMLSFVNGSSDILTVVDDGAILKADQKQYTETVEDGSTEETKTSTGNISISGHNDTNIVNVAAGLNLGSGSGAIGMGLAYNDFAVKNIAGVADVSEQIKGLYTTKEHYTDENGEDAVRYVVDEDKVKELNDKLSNNYTASKADNGSISGDGFNVDAATEGSIQSVSVAGSASKNDDTGETSFFGKIKGGISNLENNLLGTGGKLDTVTGKIFGTESGKANDFFNMGKNTHGGSGGIKLDNKTSGKGGFMPSFSIAGSGSVSMNMLDNATQAIVDNAKITMNNNGDINVTARDVSYAGAYSGAAALQWKSGGSASDKSVGFSGAAGVNDITNKVNAAIKNSAIKNAGELNTMALSGGEQLALGLGLNVVKSGNTSGYSGNAAVSVNLIDHDVEALHENNTVQDTDDINVAAYARDIENTGGGSLSAGQQKVGIGASVGVAMLNNNISAGIKGGSYTNVGSIEVDALNALKNITVGVAAGLSVASGSGTGATVEGAGVYNEVHNTTNAFIEGSKDNKVVISTVDGGSVNVVAQDVAIDASLLNEVNDNEGSETKIADYEQALNELADGEAEIKNRMGEDFDITGSNELNSIDMSDAVNELNKNKQDNEEKETVNLNKDGGSSIITVAAGLAGSTNKGAGGAAVAITDIENTYTAKIDYADITAETISADAGSNSNIVTVAGGIAAASKGSGVGSVSWNDVVNTANVDIFNSTVNAQSTTAKANNTAQIVSVGGQISGAGKAAVGATLSYVGLDNSTEVNIKNTAFEKRDEAEADDTSVTAEATNRSDSYNIGAGVSAAGTASVSGTVVVTQTHGTAGAVMDNVTINNAKAVTAKALDDTDILSVIGSINASGKVAAGAGVAYTEIGDVSTDTENGQHVTAEIKNSTINSADAGSTVSANAEDTARVYNIAIGVGGSGNVAVQGASATTLINKVTSAGINNTNIDADQTNIDADQDDSTKANVTVDAQNSSEITSSASTVVVAGQGAGVGAGIAVNRIIQQTNASVNGGTMNINNLTVNANAAPRIENIGVGGAVAGQGAGISGSVAVNMIENNVTAHIGGGANIVANDNVGVVATSDEQISNYSGMLSVAGQGAGVGISVSVNQIEGTTSATVGGVNETETNVIAKGNGDGLTTNTVIADDEINNALISDETVDKDTTITRTDEIRSGLIVDASSTRDLKSFLITAGVAGEGAGVAGTVNVNMIDGATDAGITNTTVNGGVAGAAVGNNADVFVNAGDYSNMSGFVGSAAVGGVGAGVGLASDTNTISRDVTASVENSNIKAQTFEVDADSAQGVSSFGVGAGAAGIGGGVAGVVTVTELENTTKTLLNNSKVNANTVSIKANHTGIVNAGNVSAGGAGLGVGGGLSVGVLKDNSTTEVTVNGTDTKEDTITANGDVIIAATNTATVNPMISANGVGAFGGVAGATSINNLNSKVKTNIEGVGITSTNGSISGTASNTFNVKAYMGTIGGGAVGAGAGVTVNTIDSTVQTNVTDSTLNADDNVTLTAEETRNIEQLATNVAAGGVAVDANIAITNVGQEITDQETLSKIDEVNSVYGKDGSDAKTLIGGADSALTTAGIDKKNVTPHVDAEIGGEDDKESQITVNITNSDIDAGNTFTAKATEKDNINMTLGGASGGAIAVAAGVGILNVHRNVGVNINGGQIDAETVDIDTDITGEANLNVYQSSAGVVAGNAAYAGVTTTGNSKIVLEDRTVINAKDVNITAADNGKTTLQAIGVAAGGVALGALAAEAENDSDVSVILSGATINAEEESEEDGSVTIKSNKNNAVTAQAVGVAGGAIGGAGMGANVTDKGSSTVSLTGNEITADNNIDVDAITNSTLTANINNDAAGVFASGSVSIATVNAGTKTDHMITSVDIGAGNVFTAENTSFDAKSAITQDIDMLALSISGYGAIGGNTTTTSAYADATVTAEDNNTYRGTGYKTADGEEESYNAGNVSFNAANTVTQTADTSGVSASGLFATGTNIGNTISNLTTKVDINGSSAESNINDLDATASSYASVSNTVNGDGGSIADISPYAAMVENNYTADTDVIIGGDWNTAGSFTAQALNGMDIDLKSDAVRAAVIGGSGTWLNNVIDNDANVTVNANITTGGAQNYTAQNNVDYNGEIDGSGYGGLNVNATDYKDNLAFTAGVDITDSTLHGVGDDASITAYANTQGSITSKNSLKSAGVIPVALAFSDHTINYDHSVNATNSNLTTDKKDADITLATNDNTDVKLETIADTQGGVVGAASAEASNDLTRGNYINIDGESAILSTKDINLYAGADANGTKSSLDLQVLADAYNKTAIPVYTDPTVDNTMKQYNQIGIAGNVSSVRHINASAAKGTTTVVESAKEYKVWTGTGGEGEVASTAFGDNIKNEDSQNYINVTGSGSVKAGIHNKLDITIGGESSITQPEYKDKVDENGNVIYGDDGKPVQELVSGGGLTYNKDNIAINAGSDWFSKDDIDSSSIIITNGLMERYNEVMDYLQAYDKNSDAYKAYEAEKNLLLLEMQKAGMAEKADNGTLVPLDYIEVPAISLPDIVVSGGNINLDTDKLTGTKEGSIVAQGAPQLKITNNSDLYLQVHDLTISDNGGRINLTGTQEFAGTYQADGVSDAVPTITIEGTSPEAGAFNNGNAHPQADIGIFGDITNTAGDVNITNDNYNILINGNVSGRNITIAATKGNVTQQSSTGVLNVGNDPITRLQFSEEVAKKIQTYLYNKKQSGEKSFKNYQEYLNWLVNDVGITLDELGISGKIEYIAISDSESSLLYKVKLNTDLITGLLMTNEEAKEILDSKKTDFSTYVSYLEDIGASFSYDLSDVEDALTDESAGIIAGGNIYLDAVNINIGGLIQSGYGSYATELSNADAGKVAALDAEWQANQKPLTDADVMGNEKYLVNGGGEVFNTKTKVWDYEVKVYYNPSTGQLITEDVKPEGGNIQISGKVSSTGNGRIMAMDGTSDVSINTTAVDKDVKVNSISVNDITGLISITDKNITKDSNGNDIDGWVTEYKNGQWREYAYGTDATDIKWQDGSKNTYQPEAGTQFAWTGGVTGEVIRQKHYTEDFLFWGALAYNTSEALLDHLKQINVTPEETIISSNKDPQAMKDGTLITDGYKGGDDMFRIDWTYSNSQDNVTATDPSVKKEYDGTAGKIFGYGEYIYTWTETSGDKMTSTSGIKADNTINIGFLGNGEGNGDITVNTAQDMLLNGNISNATVLDDNNNFIGKGSVNLNSGGNIEAISSANINSDDVNITAANGVNVNHAAIGDSANINVTTTNGDIKFVSTDGNLNIEQMITGGNDAITAATGSVYLEAQGNIIDATTGTYAIKGQRIDLISNTGNIGSKDNALTILGGSDLYSSDTMASSVNAKAQGDIVLTQTDGNMRLGTIESVNGDAVLTVANGSFVDAHPSENTDTSSAQDKIDRWVEAGLIVEGADADSSEESAKLAKEEREAALNARADALANGDETKKQSYKEAAEMLAGAFADAENNKELQTAKDTYINEYQAAVAAYNEKIAGVTDQEQIDQINNDYKEIYDGITNKYLEAQAKVYGSEFTADEQQLISSYAEVSHSDNYGWSQNQLLYAIQDSVLNAEPGEVQTVDTPNVTANNITLNAVNGGIGIDADAKYIKYDELNNEEKLKILAAAKAGDLTWDNANSQVIVRQQQAITVSVKSQDEGETYGKVNVTGRDNVYLAGVKDTELNINGVETAGDIRLQGDAGVNVDGMLTGEDLTINGGTGNIMGSDFINDVGYVKTNVKGNVYANAMGDINIHHTDNLNLLAISTYKSANLKADGSILMYTDDNTEARGRINANIVNLEAGANIGSSDNTIRILDNGAVVNANAGQNIYLSGVRGDGSTGELVLGTIKGANLDVTSESDISLGRDNNEEDETVNSNVNVGSGNVTLTTNSGSITQTAGSSITADSVNASATENILLGSESNKVNNFVVNGAGEGNNLNGDVTLVSTANNTENTVKVDFAKGEQGLTVNGTVTVNALGDSTELNITGGSLTTTGENADSVTFTSAGSITANTTINSAADIVMNAQGAITNTGSLTAGNKVNVNTDAGDIELGGDVTAQKDVIVHSDKGAIEISGTVTATDNDVNITSGSGAITTTGAITGGTNVNVTTEDGAINIGGEDGKGNVTANNGNVNITSGSGAITTTGAITGGTDVTVNAGTKGTIDLGGSVDAKGGNVLVTTDDGYINTTGNITANKVVDVNTDKGSIKLDGTVTATTSDVNITSGEGTITTTGAISGGNDVNVTTASGAINIGSEAGNGNVTANNNINIDTNAGDITLNGKVNSINGFTHIAAGTYDDTGVTTDDKGNVTVNGEIASGDEVIVNAVNGSITVNGTTTANNGNVETTVNGDGNINLNGTVTASGDVTATVTGEGDITTGDKATVSGTNIIFTTNDGNITTGSNLTADKNVDLNVNTGNITFGGDVTANDGNITIDITGDGSLKDAENANNTLTAEGQEGSADSGNIIINLKGEGDVDLYDLYATNNARLDIANGSLTLHEINGELVAMQLRTEGKEMDVDKITAGTQIVLTGSDMSLDNIAQRQDADGMLVVTPDGAQADKPIDNFTIGNIQTNAGSGIRFDHLWVNNSDIHISEGQLWFDKLYVEDNAHFSNDEMTAAIYGKPPLRDGSDSVYWINTEENRPESSLDMWLNGTGDWMYLRFTDDHIQESNGILLTLDEYDYVYDQRFTAENHLRWQHGRYLDEDWKQAYGYGLSLHNRYGLIDYQEFTETNAGADEVAVEA